MNPGLLYIWEGLISSDYRHLGLDGTLVMKGTESTKREGVLNTCLVEHFHSHGKKVPQRQSQRPQARVNQHFPRDRGTLSTNGLQRGNLKVRPFTGHFKLMLPSLTTVIPGHIPC